VSASEEALDHARRAVGDKAIEVMDLVTPELVELLERQGEADFAVADHLYERGMATHDVAKFMVGTLMHRLLAP
jgi:hypothetical protein